MKYFKHSMLLSIIIMLTVSMALAQQKPFIINDTLTLAQYEA
jgi:hypothetical protein